MQRFKMRYIYGFQGELKQEDMGYSEAPSLQDALRAKSDRPIEVRYNCAFAWAKNPGTSFYYVEVFEVDIW